MTGIIFYRVILLINIVLSGYLHPIHISVTSIEYFADRNVFLASFKIFTDDFENILTLKYGIELELETDSELDKQKQYVTKYISDSFGFFVNGDILLQPQFKEKTMNEEAVWLYYSYKCKKEVSSIKIRNAILMDMFDDQTNLLIFKYHDFERGYQFKKNNKEIMIEIER